MISGRLRVSTTVLRRVAFASIVANVGIVVTGGAVRLTGSGLGCPTWPRCTEGSYVVTPQMGGHGAIEFGNRMLTFAVGLIAVAGVVAALLHRPEPPRQRRRRTTWLAVLVFLGIPAQAILGGITVLTDLNPWVVGGHFLVSMAVIAAAYAFWRSTDPAPPAACRPSVPAPLRTLARLTAAVCVAVLVVGTFVTGSGPHSGDANARRNGLDPESISQVHADLVFLLVGLSVALWFALRAVGAAATIRRAAGVLIVVELAQGLVGFVQYVAGLPALAVGLHMFGACLLWLAVLAVVAATADRRPAPPAPPPPGSGRPDPEDPATTGIVASGPVPSGSVTSPFVETAA